MKHSTCTASPWQTHAAEEALNQGFYHAQAAVRTSKLLEVQLVGFGEDEGFHTAAPGCDGLLLDAANRQNAPGQSHLT
jgi:hypothetical protein